MTYPGGEVRQELHSVRGTYTICNDIRSDPKMAPWHKGALERGYHSLAAFPFALDSQNTRRDNVLLV